MRAARPEEHGSAMVVTLMVMALVTALGTVLAAVTVENLRSARAAQQAGAALGAADAGLAQATAYLRANGVRGLSCSPSCAGNPWGNRTSPASVSVPGVAGQAYRVWIEPIAPYPANDPGLYRIHSTGAAKGDASRAVTADVQVTTTDVPRGIFARTVNGGGAASVARESIFSTGCVYDRSKIVMTGTDLAYGIPVAVHSSQIITDSNGSGQYCPTTNKPIHRTPPLYRDERPCDPLNPFDQDLLGGSLSGTLCESAQSLYPDFYGPRDVDGDGENDVHGSRIDDDALTELFGIRSPALSQAQLDELRTIAQSQGNYWNYASSNVWSSPDEAQAVMFFDLAATDPGGTVDLNDVAGFSRGLGLGLLDAGCPDKSLLIVIDGGNVRLNSNHRLFGSIFLTSSAPNGQVFKENGNSSFIGTLYADTINLAGTADISVDECFMANVSPALLEFTVQNYREVDR